LKATIYARWGGALVLAAAWAAAQDHWYAIYLGKEHIGYSYVVDDRRPYNGVDCRYTKIVVNVAKEGVVRVVFRHAAELYFDGDGLLYYYSNRDDDGVITDITGQRTTAGLTFKVVKNGQTETKTFPAADYDFTTFDDVPRLGGPGTAKNFRVVDLDEMKLKKAKLTYVEDAQMDVNGSHAKAAVFTSDIGLSRSKYWLAADGHTAYKITKQHIYGTISIVETAAGKAKP
jgi:hypothetical protein